MPSRTQPAASALAGILCIGGLLLAPAALILTRIAWKMTGAPDIFFAVSDPALFEAMRNVWGLFLAANIVKVVAACVFAATFWLVWLALPLRGRLAVPALVLGSAAGVLLTLGFRLGIRASAWLGGGLGPEGGEVAQQLVAGGMVCAGLGIALLGIEGRRFGLFPQWIPALGMILALLGFAHGLLPLAVIGLPLVMMIWWASLLRPLLGSEPLTA